jgi:DNA-binding transcriptional regulator YiaG
LALLQKAVASRLQVNAWTYLGWEHDRRQPPLRFWPRIIGFLGYDPSPEPQTLGERIWAERRKLGLSQAEAARLLGLEEGTLRRYERGKDQPTPAILDTFETFFFYKQNT